jgi:WD40 repeat protein
MGSARDTAVSLSMCQDSHKAHSNLLVNVGSGHTKEIYDLAWSPCGRYFITGAIDNTACVWNLEDSK